MFFVFFFLAWSTPSWFSEAFGTTSTGAKAVPRRGETLLGVGGAAAAAAAARTHRGGSENGGGEDSNVVGSVDNCK